ncbi:hypothetical protein MMC25_003773 [Agyrium rufum]|nr:hypothetical protein [Agyrium rufum]
MDSARRDQHLSQYPIFFSDSISQSHSLVNDPMPNAARFSYQVTPDLITQPFGSPTNSSIDESPISPHFDHDFFDSHPLEAHEQPEYPQEKATQHADAGPYNQPPLAELHPAHLGQWPVHSFNVDPSPAYHLPPTISPPPQPRGPSTQELLTTPRALSDVRISQPGGLQYSNNSQPSTHVQSGTIDDAAPRPPPKPRYNSYAPAGPNPLNGKHEPGQARHAKSNVESEWRHGMCELDSTCCIGLFCPCILYGKTQHRLSQKAKRREATDLLGYKTCNGSWLLVAVQRTRLRKTYSLNSSDEREMKGREQVIRRNTILITTPYTSPSSHMVYEAPDR